MKIKSDSALGILRPALTRIPGDWAIYTAVLLALLCAYIQSLGLIADRPHIVREAVTLGAGIDVGALAVIVAASTIFASLMTKRFLELIREVDYLISVFALSILLLLSSVIYAFLLYLLSYAGPFVASQGFFAICVLGEWLFFWGILQIVDAARIVSLQMLVISRASPHHTLSREKEPTEAQKA